MSENEKGVRVPYWSIRVALSSVVDPNRVRIDDSDPIGEPEVLEVKKTGRGREVQRQRVTLERTITQDPEVVGEAHTPRLAFEFTNQLVIINGKERMEGHVIIRSDGSERVKEENVGALSEELGALHTNPELMALLHGKGFNHRDQREIELPPLGGGCRRAREILRVGSYGMAERDAKRAPDRRFPMDLFLRMQAYGRDLVWKPRCPYLAQGLALTEVGGTGGNYTKPTKIALAQKPKFKNHQVEGRWIPESIIQTGWVMILEGAMFNLINKLYFWNEQRVREFACHYTTLRPVTAPKTRDPQPPRASRPPKAKTEGQPAAVGGATAQEAVPPPETTTRVEAAPPPATPAAEPAPTEQPPVSSTAGDAA